MKYGTATHVSLNGVIRIGLVGLALFVLMDPLAALAGTPGPTTTATGQWAAILNNIVVLMTGPVAKGAAIIAVVALGFMAMAGKLSWDTAIKIVLGIVLIFSSVTIVKWLSSSSGGDASGDAKTFIEGT